VPLAGLEANAGQLSVARGQSAKNRAWSIGHTEAEVLRNKRRICVNLCRFVSYASSGKGGEELRFAHEAFASNYIAAWGPQVDTFEREFCEKTSAKHAAALSCGTAVLHLALQLECGIIR